MGCDFLCNLYGMVVKLPQIIWPIYYNTVLGYFLKYVNILSPVPTHKINESSIVMILWQIVQKR